MAALRTVAITAGPCQPGDGEGRGGVEVAGPGLRTGASGCQARTGQVRLTFLVMFVLLALFL